MALQLCHTKEKIFMNGNTHNIEKPVRNKIIPSEDNDVQYWSKKLGVSEEGLKRAVKNIGLYSKELEAFLNKKTQKNK